MFFLLIVSGALASLAICGRRLPAQNVVSLAVITLFTSGLLEIINAHTGFPFGKVIFRDWFGAKLFGVLPWPIPFIWLIAILNARGTAQLILQPWRPAKKNYGIWLLGLSALLATILLFDFQVYAIEIRYFIRVDSEYAGNMKIMFGSRLIVTLILFLLLTAWFINKKPVEPKPDYFPLILWLLANSYLAVAAFIHHAFVSALCMFLASVIVGFSATIPSVRQSSSS